MAHGQAGAEIVSGGGSPTLTCNHEAPIVCISGEITHTLKAEGFDASEDGTGRGVPIVPTALATAVRRLMPVECERLQGFPDGWTDVPFGSGSAADGPRYKQLGNSWAVPHARWICGRLTAHLRDLEAQGSPRSLTLKERWLLLAA